MFQDLLSLREIHLEKNLNNFDTHILGSRFDMEQLFKNLILNAIDSMNDSSQRLLKITVSVNSLKTEAVVCIEYSGCGMSEALKNKIFNQYFTTKTHGTGLGMFVVKGILEKHNSKINIESKTGKGNCRRIDNSY